MPTTLQRRCGPALTTAGIQDAAAWGHHRIDEACLTFKIGVLGGQLSKVLGVPLGMVVLGFGEPPGSVLSEMIVRVGHGGKVPAPQGVLHYVTCPQQHVKRRGLISGRM